MNLDELTLGQIKGNKMNLDELTLGQIKEISALLGNTNTVTTVKVHPMIGKKVIIRTYSAGVWFGKLIQKDDDEVILEDARRMYQWWCKESISLSAVAVYGINQDKSKICVPVDCIWLKAIEILPCKDIAVKSIEEAVIVEQQ